MPSRDEKRRQEYYENKSSIHTDEFLNTVTYKDQAFEMMSVPDGGLGNKEALEGLKRSGK